MKIIINLHSNMVRFIIGNKTYISQQEQLDLHSNMVRFIIYEVQVLNMLIAMIYIPIWLDLLLKNNNLKYHTSFKFTFQYG